MTELPPTPFTVDFPDFGAIEIRPMVLDEDATTIHDWVSRDYAHFWGQQGLTLPQVREKYRVMLADADFDMLIGVRTATNEKIFLLECYRPERDDLARYYKARKSDRGFHLIVAPALKPVKNMAYYAISALSQYIFRDAAVGRIVAEPDIRNTKMFARCVQVGYQLGPVVHLPNKTAQLVLLTRERFTQQQAKTHAGSPPAKGNFLFRDGFVKYHLLAGRVLRKLAALSGKTAKAPNTA